MLKLEKISFSVRKNQILDEIDFNFLPNQIYAITGANGSGKSSLAKIIMGFVKPDQGRIFLENKDISRLGVAKRAQAGVGLSFQQPVKFKGVTVRDLLKIAAQKKQITDTLGSEILTEVGLDAEKYLDREVNDELSGGELKRIELATTLARQPKVAIFDEPEAGVDLWSFDELTDVFKNLKNKNRVIIIVSHQVKILEIADKILLLENGKISEFTAYKQFLKKNKTVSGNTSYEQD